MLVDVDYETYKDDGVRVRLLLKGDSGFFTMYDYDFKPYFFVDTKEKAIPKELGGRTIDVKRIKKIINNEEKAIFQIFCKHPMDVVALREHLRDIGSVYEASIPFGRRYLVDKNLRPMNEVEIRSLNDRVLDIKDAGPSNRALNTLCFDIEVYNPFIVPRERKDPIIIISYYNFQTKQCGALTLKKAETTNNTNNEKLRIDVVRDEKELIKAFCKLVEENDIELLVGYNSAAFDLNYMKDRAKALGIEFPLGRGGGWPLLKKTAMTTRVKIEGRIHFDVYYAIRLLAAAQALKTQRYTLEEVYEEIIGKKKMDLEEREMCKIWDDEKRRQEYIEYSCSDAVATAEIFKRVYPLSVELARIAQLSLSDVNGGTSGQLVESLLIGVASRENNIVPNKPGGEEMAGRENEPIVGAYVKMPEPGIYDDIAVLDFRSLYPSIIVSHNVDPFTLNCGHQECRAKNTSPSGHHFCMMKKGIVPLTLSDLLNRRKELKRKLKIVKGEEASTINARVAALKIITNTFYGMLRYVRARWYSREAAESITAWGRYYVQDVAKKAGEYGFEVLYADTDSIFLLLKGKKENEVNDFVERVNAELPEDMELELEDFYSRGVFVAKKTKAGKGAKKKYALISRGGKLKIRGFELVRRDWSKIARDTQRHVLNIILKEGKKEKAMEIVKGVVQNLKEGSVSKEDLIIYTQLRKRDYAIASPEFAAAEKARKRGIRMGTGAIVGYVVTKNGKSISEKAELAEFAENYDAGYYINNQVIPAVLRILGELGYSEEDIKYAGKQSSLEGWF